jgi:predicted HTH domain antitoxin
MFGVAREDREEKKLKKGTATVARSKKKKEGRERKKGKEQKRAQKSVAIEKFLEGAIEHILSVTAVVYLHHYA